MGTILDAFNKEKLTPLPSIELGIFPYLKNINGVLEVFNSPMLGTTKLYIATEHTPGINILDLISACSHYLKRTSDIEINSDTAMNTENFNKILGIRLQTLMQDSINELNQVLKSTEEK